MGSSFVYVILCIVLIYKDICKKTIRQQTRNVFHFSPNVQSNSDNNMIPTKSIQSKNVSQKNSFRNGLEQKWEKL